MKITDVSHVQFNALIPPGLDVPYFADPALATTIAHWATAFASTGPDGERVWWERVLGAKTTRECGLTVRHGSGRRHDRDQLGPGQSVAARRRARRCSPHVELPAREGGAA